MAQSPAKRPREEENEKSVSVPIILGGECPGDYNAFIAHIPASELEAWKARPELYEPTHGIAPTGMLSEAMIRAPEKWRPEFPTIGRIYDAVMGESSEKMMDLENAGLVTKTPCIHFACYM